MCEVELEVVDRWKVRSTFVRSWLYYYFITYYDTRIMYTYVIQQQYAATAVLVVRALHCCMYTAVCSLLQAVGCIITIIDTTAAAVVVVVVSCHTRRDT